MPFSTPTTHSPKHMSPAKKLYDGACAQRSSAGDPSQYDRRYHQPNKRKHKPKPRYTRKKAKPSAPLNRPSSQSPTGKLLDRIGASIEDDTDGDHVEDEKVVTDLYSNLPDSASVPHFCTPDPGEVERFLESVIGAWSPQAPITACPVCCPPRV
ncbi:hypothetical protein PAXRUDRAFT_826371 [Paxillus rubicundulus Ve08.2h10]|uniref:Uncharacterized protein n=1 Tax=Paxillus rubicundulus Ve08.2h10 TaxID=930991 RepID=A0A0D0E9U1_9AGAM|nr:hypothetical protein PAXRUDRAFT_826371 [Paxillus rubicundulus Ve08.2h10]